MPGAYIFTAFVLFPATGKFIGIASTDRMGYDIVEYDPATKSERILAGNVLSEWGNLGLGYVSVDLYSSKIIAPYPNPGFAVIMNFDGTAKQVVHYPEDTWIMGWKVYPYSIGTGRPGVEYRITTFADYDSNCKNENHGVPLPFASLTLRPDNQIYYADYKGTTRLYLQEGDYEFQARPSDLWETHCPDFTKRVVIDEQFPAETPEPIELFLQPKVIVQNMEVSLTSDRLIAGRDVKYLITYRNTGTLPFSGTLAFEYDEILTNFRASPIVDAHSAPSAFWKINNLPIGASRSIKVSLKISPDENLRGAELCASVSLDKGGSDVLAGRYSNDLTCDEIRAAYDPNDISVYPRGRGPYGYIAPDDTTLAYRIRFQNIGNAAAYNVIILDTLDPNLDIDKLHFGAASHDYSVSLREGKILEFRFDDIQLPGREEDESGSHGHVKYKVDLKQNLPIDTEIRNRAAIYFDFNAPVITNTVRTTLAGVITNVSEPLAEDKLELRSLGQGRFVLHSAESLNGTLRVYSVLGNCVLEQRLEHLSQAVLDLSAQPSGRYLIVLEHGGVTTVKSVAVLR